MSQLLPDLKSVRAKIARQNADALARIDAARVAKRVCRHCAGSIPCDSPFGDIAVGRRRLRLRRERNK